MILDQPTADTDTDTPTTDITDTDGTTNDTGTDEPTMMLLKLTQGYLAHKKLPPL